MTIFFQYALNLNCNSTNFQKIRQINVCQICTRLDQLTKTSSMFETNQSRMLKCFVFFSIFYKILTLWGNAVFTQFLHIFWTKSKQKLTYKIRVLEYLEQISLNKKKRLLDEMKKNLKDINRKKCVIKNIIYLYYPLKTGKVIMSRLCHQC